MISPFSKSEKKAIKRQRLRHTTSNEAKIAIINVAKNHLKKEIMKTLVKIIDKGFLLNKIILFITLKRIKVKFLWHYALVLFLSFKMNEKIIWK